MPATDNCSLSVDRKKYGTKKCPGRVDSQTDFPGRNDGYFVGKTYSARERGNTVDSGVLESRKPSPGRAPINEKNRARGYNHGNRPETKSRGRPRQRIGVDPGKIRCRPATARVRPVKRGFNARVRIRFLIFFSIVAYKTSDVLVVGNVSVLFFLFPSHFRFN